MVRFPAGACAFTLALLTSLLPAQQAVPDAARAAFGKAEIAREEGRLEEAVRLYREALDAAPLYVEAHAGYLAALRGQGDLFPARDFYGKLVGAHPESFELKVFQAAALDPADAVEALQKLAGSREDHVRVWIELGRACLRAGDSRGAEKALKSALKIEPDNRLALLLLGDQEFTDEKYTNARKQYEAALALDPTWGPARVRLALSWFRQEKLDRATEVLDELLSENGLPRMVAGHWVRARILTETGDFDGALKAMDTVLGIDKDDPAALMAKGNILLLQEKPNDAVKVFQEVVKQRANSAEAIFALAWAYEQAADLPENSDAQRRDLLLLAAENYDKCTRLDPGVRPRDSLGYVSLRADMYGEALTHLKRAIDIDPEFAPAHSNLGMAHDIADDRASAKKRYEHVLSKIDKANIRARVMLALDLWIDGSAPKAIRELERALKDAPEDDLAWTFLGDIHYDNGKVDQAIRAYKEATECNPKNFIAWYHMGIAWDDDKRRDEDADQCYRKAWECRAVPPAELALRIAIVNDEDALERLEEALKFYQSYRDLGGTEDWVPERITVLQEKLAR